MRRAFLCFGLAAALWAMTYTDEIEHWREQREVRLKADDGWLTVAGLFWLHEGQNTAGSDPSNDIVLPRGPAYAGTFDLRAGTISFQPNGEARAKHLKTDTGSSPDLVEFDDLTLFAIVRGKRYGIRLKDKQSPFRRNFTGLHWYPVREEYRITAKWVAYAQPKPMAVPNILGETEQEPSPGYAVFTLHGHEFELHPVLEDQQLFFIFRDQTAGRETYPSGRFLYADLPSGGHVLLDFNKAYNPPCAFTPYATCPLPPPANRLSAKIEAGELNYEH